MFDSEITFTPDHLDALIVYLKHHRDNGNTIEDVLSEIEYRRFPVDSHTSA